MISYSVGSHLVVAALLTTLAPAAALAQAQGGKAAGGPGGGGSSPPAGAVLLYGTPGNCPPTVACGPNLPVPGDRKRHCVKWEVTRGASGTSVRRCLDP